MLMTGQRCGSACCSMATSDDPRRPAPEVPLRPEEREVALVWLSALACVGLKDDSLEVRLDSVVNGEIHNEVTAPCQVDGGGSGGMLRLVDQRLAAAWGSRLGLVELPASRVRFPHSLIQAFLGSQMMDAALRDPDYVSEALYGTPDSERTGPGRKFLIALALHSRSKLIEQERGQPSGVLDSSPDSAGAVCYQLAEAAGARHDNKALDIYAAAMEISTVAVRHQRTIAGIDGGPSKGVAQHTSEAATKTGAIGRRARPRISVDFFFFFFFFFIIMCTARRAVRTAT